MALVNRTSVSTCGVRGIPSDRSRTSKYCDVCYGAGKSFEEYTSHYVKSKVGPDGVVTCPTILNSICTYCKKKGHFKSACEVLKNKNKNKKITAPTDAADNKKEELLNLVKNYKQTGEKRQRDGNIIHKNTFDCLFIGDDEDSSDSDTDTDMNDSEFPPIPPLLVRSQTNKHPDRIIKDNIKKMSYADALESAAKTFPSAVAAAVSAKTSSNSAGASLLAYINNTPPPLVTVRNNKYRANGTRRSWADTDSESEFGSDDDDE